MEDTERCTMNRIPRTSYFMEVAKLSSQRSSCTKLQVGCVLVKDNRIIATGTNGSPSNMKHCIDAGCLEVDNHCIRATHAEQNVIAICAKYGISTDQCNIYITHFPCTTCLKVLINAGIKKIYYSIAYKSEIGMSILGEALKERLITIKQIHEGNENE